MSAEAKKDQAKETELPEDQLEKASGGAERKRNFYDAHIKSVEFPAADGETDDPSLSDKR